MLFLHYVSLSSVFYKDTVVSLVLVFPCVNCENVTHRKLQKRDYRDGLNIKGYTHTHTQADHPIHPN